MTEDGAAAAVIAGKIVESLSDERAFAIIKRSWIVPILALTGTPQRFSSIKAALGGVTDRALSQSLILLEDHDWLKREIDVSQRAPFPTYLAINEGRKINLAINSELELSK